MAQTKKLDATGLSQVWAKIIADFIAKGGADLNVIESVKVNGAAVTITDKAVDIVVPKGALASLDKVDEAHLADAVMTIINGKADKATTLSGYGIADAYTKDETYTRTEADSAISTAVKQAIAGVYVVKGSVAFASLPTTGMEAGWVYNISDAFTTTAGFVEGAGKSYPAGTNVVYTAEGWDALPGTYDFSGYLKAEDLADITAAETTRPVQCRSSEPTGRAGSRTAGQQSSIGTR